jgi:hypothetical protein
MKMVKSLLLGTAAGLVAMTGAQAADLPVKAKPVQYVKICSLYGAGFYYMPGTDTCLKVGGFVRTEYNFHSGGSFSVRQRVNWDNPADTLNTWRSRAYVTLDARSQTEYGTLRSYFAGGFQWENGSPGSNALTNAIRGFIQWAGFTAGRAQSFFDFYNTPAFSNQTNVWGSDSGGNGLNVLGYTAQFGNGFSATISVEDGYHRRDCSAGGAANCANTIFAVVGGGGTGLYATDDSLPDLVGNLRVDQSWGSAQIMAAVHDVRVDRSLGAPTFQDASKVGWAIGAGLTLNLPMIGTGDNISAQVTYGKGALNYVGSGVGTNNTGVAASSNWAVCEGGGLAGAASCAYGPVADGVVLASGALSLSEGWSVVAGFKHVWNPRWNTTLFGSYGEVSYSATANTALCGSATCADWSLWQIGSRTTWTPVTNLDLSMEVMWNNLNSSAAAVGAQPAPLTGAIDDKGWLQAMVRAQRNFYP